MYCLSHGPSLLVMLAALLVELSAVSSLGLSYSVSSMTSARQAGEAMVYLLVVPYTIYLH